MHAVGFAFICLPLLILAFEDFSTFSGISQVFVERNCMLLFLLTYSHIIFIQMNNIKEILKNSEWYRHIFGKSKS